MPSRFSAEIIELGHQLQRIIDKNLKLAESIGPETRTAIEAILRDHPQREPTPESQSSRSSSRLRSPPEPEPFPTEWLNSKHTFNAALRRFVTAVKPPTTSPPDTNDSQGDQGNSQRQTPESGTTEEIAREGVPSGSATHVTMSEANPNLPGSGSGLTPDMRQDIVQLITQTMQTLNAGANAGIPGNPGNV
jgi:hypothetical protein